MESASNVGEMRHEIRLNKEEKRRFLNGLRNATSDHKEKVDDLLRDVEQLLNDISKFSMATKTSSDETWIDQKGANGGNAKGGDEETDCDEAMNDDINPSDLCDESTDTVEPIRIAKVVIRTTDPDSGE